MFKNLPSGVLGVRISSTLARLYESAFNTAENCGATSDRASRMFADDMIANAVKLYNFAVKDDGLTEAEADELTNDAIAYSISKNEDYINDKPVLIDRASAFAAIKVYQNTKGKGKTSISTAESVGLAIHVCSMIKPLDVTGAEALRITVVLLHVAAKVYRIVKSRGASEHDLFALLSVVEGVAPAAAFFYRLERNNGATDGDARTVVATTALVALKAHLAAKRKGATDSDARQVVSAAVSAYRDAKDYGYTSDDASMKIAAAVSDIALGACNFAKNKGMADATDAFHAISNAVVAAARAYHTAKDKGAADTDTDAVKTITGIVSAAVKAYQEARGKGSTHVKAIEDADNVISDYNAVVKDADS